MATIKSYTDIEQSKRLAKILSIESADMVYEGYNDYLRNEINYTIGLVSDWKSSYPDRNIFEDWDDTFIPCWSLSALFSIMSDVKLCNYKDKYFCQYIGLVDDFPKYSTFEYDNPVDACVEMIEKLHELNLL